MYECIRCGFPIHKADYCNLCALRIEQLSEQWDDTVDDLADELRKNLRAIFYDLDELLPVGKTVDTIAILKAALDRSPFKHFYDSQLRGIHSNFLEPTYWEMAEREEVIEDHRTNMKIMEMRDK